VPRVRRGFDRLTLAGGWGKSPCDSISRDCTWMMYSRSE
jgi:hypothetical protein